VSLFAERQQITMRTLRPDVSGGAGVSDVEMTPRPYAKDTIIGIPAAHAFMYGRDIWAA